MTKPSAIRSHLAACLFLATVLFHACSDCEEPIPNETLSAIEYMPMTAGSWWAYSIHKRDPFMGDLLLGRDTLRVVGEFEQNGTIYAQLEGSMLLFQNSVQSFGLRDSLGFLVNDNGRIVLPELNFTDTFNHFFYEGELVRFWQLFEDAEMTVVPAGSFQTIDFRGHQFRELVGHCVDTIGLMHSQFAHGVGLVRATYWYSAQGGERSVVHDHEPADHQEVQVVGGVCRRGELDQLRAA